MRSFGGWLKQSAAVTVCVGPFVDAIDDVTAESGLASGMDTSSGVMLSKNAGTLAVRASGISATTYDTRGYYKVSLTATDTNTLGALTLDYSLPVTARPVCIDYLIVPANTYDSLVGGSDTLQADLIQINGATGPVSGISDFASSGYTVASHKVNGVILADTVTNLTNAPSAGDLTSTMKASVTTAVNAATGLVAASVVAPVTVSGDFTSTMKTSIGTAVRTQIDSTAITGPVTGSLGKLAQDYLDASVSSRLGPTGVLSTVTNLTNAPTSGDFTATMKTSLVSGVNYASGMVVASVAGAVGSVTTKTGFKLASDGLDAVAAPADLANDAAARATFVGMFRALFNRFYNYVSQSTTQQIVKNDSGTVVSTMPVMIIAGVEEKGKSS
jgi:hypothetical protein